MKGSLRLSLVGVLALVALAQPRGFSGMARGVHGPSHGARPGNAPAVNRVGFRQPSIYPGGFFPYGFPLLGEDYSGGSPPPSNVNVIQQPPAGPEPGEEQPSHKPVMSAIRDYHWPSVPENVPAETASPTFSIALKDHTVHAAAAVAVQDGVLHYVTPEGEHRQVPLAGVDRELTSKSNREKGLRLQLW